MDLAGIAKIARQLAATEHVAAGRLADYDVLYTADPCISDRAVAEIASWAKGGGSLFGSCAAGSRNEFNEPVPGLAPLFGIEPVVSTTVQPREYRVCGGLNPLNWLAQVQLADSDMIGGFDAFGALGVI